MGEVWFASDDPSLPTPWKGVVDGTTGCVYYWNPDTNITQYEKPAYLVSSLSPSPSCFPDPFYPPPSTASAYNLHSQYPNLYPHYQAPAETVINGYTFPTQFPFPNHTHTPTNQPINPQSQSTDYHYHLLTHPSIAHPSYHLPPFATSAYPSESDYGYLSSLPYPSDQPFSCDSYSTSPHNSSYSQITYPHTEPKESIVPLYQLPYASDLIPPSALAHTAIGTSCIEKNDVPPSEMKKSLRHNLKMQSRVMMKRKSRSQFPRRRRTQNNGGSEGDSCRAPLLMAVNWDSTVLSAKSIDSISELTILDLAVKNGSISTSSKDAPMFFPGDKKKPFLSADVVYDQLLGSDELYPTERAKDILLLEGFRQVLNKKSGPLVDNDLSSIDMEFARSYLNLHLEMLLMDSGNIPEANVQGAILNHFYQVTNLISGLKPNLLSSSFVELPVILEVSIPECYDLGSKHEAVEFDKLMRRSFTVIKLIKSLGGAHLAHLQATLPNWQVRVKNVLSSNKGGFDYDVNLENLIESFTSNLRKLFVNKHGKRIESKCSVLYHWLPSSLNWNKKCFSDAFLSHEFSLSSVTLKFLPLEFCKGGSKFLRKAMVEASLENSGLKVVLSAHWKVMDYVIHSIGALVIVSMVHTISTALVDDQSFGGALIVLELQLVLLTIVVLPFAAVKQLLVIGINSDGLVIAPIADSCNKKLLVCSLITTAASRKTWGQFISLEKCNLDDQLNFLVQCTFRIKCQHMDKSCILHSCRKHLDQSHFLVQLQKDSGIIFVAILGQLKQTYGVICFVSLVEGCLVNYLLSSEAKMSEHWSNKSSKFGECRIHELSHCMDKMKISPKLDDTSWKLVVIKSVKVILTQAIIFYCYVMWPIPLVILHIGCGSYFFFYECVSHFRTAAENPTIINRGATDDHMLSCELATGTLGRLKLYGFCEFSLGHLQGEPTLLKVTSVVFSVAAIELGHHNYSLEQFDDLLKFNSMVIPLRYHSGAYLTLANSILVFELVLTFHAHASYYNSPRHYITKQEILATFWLWLLTALSSFKDWVINLHGLSVIWSHLLIGNTFFTRKLKFVHESHVTPTGTMATGLDSHSGEELDITNSDLFMEYSTLRQITDDFVRLYFPLWCFLRFTCDIPNDVAWPRYWRLDYTLAWDLMLMDNETTLSTLIVICKGTPKQSKIDKYMVQNSQGAISKWGCSTHKNDTKIMLPECLTFYIGAFCFNASIVIWEGQLTSTSTTQALYDDHEVVGCAISFLKQQTAQVLLLPNPREENHVMLATSIILTTPTCKLLVPAFIMEEWMDEVDGMIKEMIQRGMVFAEMLSPHFSIPTGLRPEDMPLFKRGGMLGLLCYNYLLSWGNVMGYLNGLHTYIGLYNYMGNWIRVWSYCKRVFRVC